MNQVILTEKETAGKETNTAGSDTEQMENNDDNCSDDATEDEGNDNMECSDGNSDTSENTPTKK